MSNLPGVAAAASSFDANDRLLSDTSDNNGNTLASEKGTDEYDFENRLLKRTKPDGTVVTLVYNADGDRMRKTVVATNGVSVVTRFLNDRNNPTGYSLVLEELDAAGNVLAVNTFGHDLIAREAGADVRYYVYDGHGSVRALTDASGIETDRYDYDAFGLLIQRQALNPLTGLLEDVPVTFPGFHLASDAFILQPYLYCGEFFDHDLGMVFLRARYMDPDRGRFWTMDDFEGYSSDPATLHKYLYANADPVNGVDPLGRATLLEVLQAIKNQMVVTTSQIYPRIRPAVAIRRNVCKAADVIVDVHEGIENIGDAVEGIYVIYNLVNGSMYVGESTVDIKSRINSHMADEMKEDLFEGGKYKVVALEIDIEGNVGTGGPAAQVVRNYEQIAIDQLYGDGADISKKDLDAIPGSAKNKWRGRSLKKYITWLEGLCPENK